MKKTVFFIVAAAMSCGGGLGATSTAKSTTVTGPTITVGKYPKLFRGANMMRVAVVPVTSSDGTEALLEVTGTDSAVDGVVFPAKLKRDRARTAWVIQMKGENYWYLVHEKKEYPRRSEKYGVLLPEDYRRRIDITFSEEDSKTLDTADIVARFKTQAADGTLAKWQDWNRDERETTQSQYLSEATAKASELCGAELTSSIDYSSVTDEMLKDKAVGSYCSTAASQLGKLCKRFKGVRTAVKAHGKKITCSWKADEGLKKASDGYSYGPYEKNSAAHARTDAVAITGAEKILLKGPQGMRILMSTSDAKMYYGIGSTMSEHRSFDHSASTHSRRLFGAKARSGIRWDQRKEHWELRCDDRRFSFVEESYSERDKFLAKVKFKPQKFQRVARALARDTRGNYYYVDGKITDAGGKDYKVYIGKKGAARVTNLKDIVNDSEGLIFATRKGDLRLLVRGHIERRGVIQSARWARGKNKLKPLTVLGLDSNRGLIYEELGVYEGQSFGTICEEM